jgi:hypothetical protein
MFDLADEALDQMPCPVRYAVGKPNALHPEVIIFRRAPERMSQYVKRSGGAIIWRESDVD